MRPWWGWWLVLLVVLLLVTDPVPKATADDNTPPAQLFMEGLAASIQAGTVAYPEGDITRELRTFRYELSPGGRVKYSAPEGLHDDCVCALAMAVESLRQRVPVRVSVFEAGKPRRREPVPMDFEKARQDWNFGF